MEQQRAISRGHVGVPIVEDSYKVDFQILDRYQRYSAELLRLSLLGIAGYGFLVKDLVFVNQQNINRFQYGLIESRWLLIIGTIMLGLSAACALGHRGMSTDATACMIAFIRVTDTTHPELLDPDKAEKERRWFHTQLKWA